MSSLRSSCEAVLRANDRGRFTVPSPHLYPHQWAWDSAFAALGWSYLDRDRALVELATLLEHHWPDGRVPHIVFHDRDGDYFPGPDAWETEQTTSISQPPIWASCARRIAEATSSIDGLAELLPAMDASHRFFHDHRDPLGWSCVAVAHPWESGMDNSPAWDRALERVDRSLAPPFERRDSRAVDDPDVRPVDDHYVAYMALVKAIAKDGFGPGPFAVYDPFFTAVLVRAEEDLAWLGERCGVETEARERGARARAGLEAHLWDEDLGRYVYFDARGREVIQNDLVGGYLPLYCGVRDDRAERLASGLDERYLRVAWPVPSTAPSDPAFEPKRYWRGPTWVNVCWMLVGALGGELGEHTVALVREHGIREYYHPEEGRGLGAEQFTWTAALTLDLLERGHGRG